MSLILTIAESALPGYQVQSWYGVLMPAGARADIVSRVNAAFVTALNAPEVRASLVAQGADPDPGTPDEFARLYAMSSCATHRSRARRASSLNNHRDAKAVT